MFKRILFFAKPTKTQINNLALDCFDAACYGRITNEENVLKVLKQAQSLGLTCKIIVMDEIQFAAGHGVIAKDVIVHKVAREGGAQ